MNRYLQNHRETEPSLRETELFIQPRSVMVILLAAVALSAIGHILVHTLSFLFDISSSSISGVYNFFSMGREANLPTYLSALLLMLSSGLCALISHQESERKQRIDWSWWLLSAGLILMSIDEAAQLHEGVIGTFLSIQIGRGEGIFYYQWYLFYIPILALISCLYIPFLKRLPKQYSLRLILAGALYFGGAIGFEMLESYLAFNQNSTAISILMEETLEMLGVVMLIQTFLLYLSQLSASVKINFTTH